VNRASTAIPVRGKVIRKEEEKEPKPAKKRGRPPKNSPKPPKEPAVIEKQALQDAKTSLDNISKSCAWGRKRNSEQWAGEVFWEEVVMPPFGGVTENRVAGWRQGGATVMRQFAA
jgi:hypothetical protein